MCRVLWHCNIALLQDGRVIEFDARQSKRRDVVTAGLDCGIVQILRHQGRQLHGKARSPFASLVQYDVLLHIIIFCLRCTFAPELAEHRRLKVRILRVTRTLVNCTALHKQARAPL